MRALLAALLFISCLGHIQPSAAADGWPDQREPLKGSSLSSGPGASTAARPGFADSLSAPELLPVDAAYQLEIEIRDDGSIRAYWHIEEGYYLYQHRFNFELIAGDELIETEIELPEALQRSDEFFGDVSVYYHGADINLKPDTRPDRAILQVGSQGCADAGLCYPPQKQRFELDFTTGTVTALAAPTPGTEGIQAQPASLAKLPYMLLLAFLGGAILNLMPCVFPILSLKVLSFTRSSDHDRHLHSWVYTAGVIVSFVSVAALLITLQHAGRAIGWGFQLQSPGFVIALAYLFTAMGLSLSGMLQLGGGIMNTGSDLANRSGLSGSFFTGVLAVVVASPCTAPFMGTALGFAVTQPPIIGLLVFAALGAGMAAPLLLFSYSGAARKLMPRPGPWMDHLKQLLAFPLYATAIWLLWVAGRQTGVNTMAAALAGALVLSLGLWLWGLGKWRRVVAVACLIAAAGLGSWRGGDDNGAGNADRFAQGRIPWSDAKLTQLRSEGKPVFLDVTADWCITCLANESAVLFTREMTAAFAEYGVVYMVADWTNYDPDIAGLLRNHGRTGIPLYLVYPPGETAEPLILPQLLTSATVLEALQQVSTKRPELTVSL